ncbi:MAG: hypothetical protein ACLT16_12440 [[Clostridium] innocuum]
MELIRAVLPVAVTGIVAVIMILILKHRRTVGKQYAKTYMAEGLSLGICLGAALGSALGSAYLACDSVLYAAGIHHWGMRIEK